MSGKSNKKQCTDSNSEYEKDQQRKIIVKDMIRAQYTECSNVSVAHMMLECDCDYFSDDRSLVKFDVPVENMSYEMICFASTKLVLEYDGLDGLQHSINLHSAHKYGGSCNNAPVGSSRVASAPGVSTTILCKCTTMAPSIRFCKLIVHALGTWPPGMKTWNELSGLEVENRMAKRLLYSNENLLFRFNRYNTIVDGGTIFAKERKGLPLPPEEQKASANLHAIQSLMRRVEMILV